MMLFCRARRALINRPNGIGVPGVSGTFTPIRPAKTAGIKKAPLTSRGLFPVLKPVPE
jgi:hypothetical protein